MNLRWIPRFKWRTITIIGMRTYMVVCSISKILHSLAERFLIAILVKINFFVLQRIEISLHRGVVVRASSFAHVLRQIMFLTEVCERLWCVRAALIAVKNVPFASPSLTAECFAERSDCQVACHTPIRQTCNNAAVIQVNNRQLYRTSPPWRNK